MSLLLRPRGIKKAGQIAYYKMDEGRNLFKYSQEFDNAAWSKSRVTILANATTAPDGTLTADKVILDGTAAEWHFVGQTFSGVADNTVMVLYAHLKKAEKTWAVLKCRSKDNTIRQAYFDLQNGVVGSISAGMTADIKPASADFYRCTVTFNILTGATTPDIGIYIADGNNDMVVDGDSVSGIYVWGAQLSTFDGPYVKTTDKQRVTDYSKPNINLVPTEHATAQSITGLLAPDGGVLAISNTEFYEGNSSISVTTNAIGKGVGIKAFYIEPGNLIGHAMIKGPAGLSVRIMMRVYYTDLAETDTIDVNHVFNGSWQKIVSNYVTTTAGKTPSYIALFIRALVSTAMTFFVDCIEIQPGTVANDWQIPPAHGTLGATLSSGTDDPTVTPEGYSFVTDDYINVGNIGAEVKTLQMVFYNNVAVNAATLAPECLCNFEGTTASYLGLGPTTSLLVDEIIAIHNTAGKSAWCDISAGVPVGWHILDARWNGTYYDIILDGVSMPITTYGTPSAITALTLQLGRRGNADMYQNGKIASTLMYSRSLTDAELAQNRRILARELKQLRGIELPPYEMDRTGLVAEYRFDDAKNILTANQSSGESGTAGFNAYNGAVISSDNTKAYHGSKSIKAVTPGAAANEGFYIISPSGSVGKAVIVQFMVWAPVGADMRVLLDDSNKNFTGTGGWQKVTHTYLLAHNNPYIYVSTQGTQAIEFYVDCIMLEYGGTASDWQLGGGDSQVLKDYADIPHNGQLGSTAGADANDPALTHEGADFTDDLIKIAANPAINDIDEMTLGIVFKADNYGGSSNGRLFDKTGSGTTGFYAHLNSGSGENRASLSWYFDGAANGQWATPNGSILTDKVYHLIITASRAAIANPPAFFINGVPQIVTTISTPVGAAKTDALQDLIIGNRSDAARVMDGKIYYAYEFNKRLSQAEAVNLDRYIKYKLAERGVLIA